MSFSQGRRDWLKLCGVGGVAFASGLVACAAERSAIRDSTPSRGARLPREDFFFLQLSDTHWGYSGAANPEAQVTLPQAVATINAVASEPDFIVFTGDLTHNTDDGATRRRRMAEFKQIVGGLKVKNLKFLPGEHDAGADRGEAFREHFGESHYSFDHKGIHFIALDNVSDPAGAVGDEQIAWLEKDLRGVATEIPVVIFAHRPLFELYPQWDWTTKDGPRVISILERRDNVTVFYGHIHQEHHHVTGKVRHHAGRSLIFPLPAPGSVPKRAPLPWDASHPGAGLGYRAVRRADAADEYRVDEVSLEHKG
jgi:hypothetical protein